MKVSRKKIVIVLILYIFCAVGWSFFSEAIARNAPDEKELGLIRLHVLANSDSNEDQILKQKVRDAILAYLEPKINWAERNSDARQIIIDNKNALIEVAYKVIHENGYNYSVDLELGVFEFPIKSYGDLVLPAGQYEAVRILIGEAKGSNWWCVLYPPLCFVEESKVNSIMLSDAEAKDEDIHFKFKIVELLKEYM